MALRNFSIRNFEEDDMEEVIDLLQSISKFKPLKNDYSNIWKDYSNQANNFSLVCTINKKVVGFGSVYIQTKIRGGKMGHIEDIVSHSKYMKKGIGHAIVRALYSIAVENSCYKVSIQCKEYNIGFYEKCDFETSGVAMQRFVK